MPLEDRHPSIQRQSSSSSLSSIASTIEEDQEKDYLITPIRFFAISRSELSLRTVLKCGQTFRWNQSKVRLLSADHQVVNKSLFNIKCEEDHLDQKPKLEQSDASDLQSQEILEWSMAWIDRTVVLRQDDHGVHYCALYWSKDLKKYQVDLARDTTYDLLQKYFVLSVSLVTLYQDWSQRDPIFSDKVRSGKWDGLRVCRQDSWETMISFICSANNNIPRISLMLNRLCATFGELMPTPPLGITLSKLKNQKTKSLKDDSSLKMYSFPSPVRLSGQDVLEKLKSLGFGYRANYVFKTSVKLCEIALQAREENHWPDFDPDTLICKKDDTESSEQKTFEPQDYLDFLAQQTYEVAHHKLVTQFSGIGPKVGDCICLFGLGFVHVVPVDVHIYKIALRDYHFCLSHPTKISSSRPQTSSQPRSQKQRSPSSSRKTKSTLSVQERLEKSRNSIQIAKPKSSSTTSTLSKLNYLKIQDFLHQLWGPWAGWTQQILFLADLNKPPS